jgi:hypothetical protein
MGTPLVVVVVGWQRNAGACCARRHAAEMNGCGRAKRQRAPSLARLARCALMR